MKWFKHMTSLRNDEAVARFLDSTGLEGFGFLCMVMEMIAENMAKEDHGCQLSLSLKRWSIALGIHRNKVLAYMDKLGSTGNTGGGLGGSTGGSTPLACVTHEQSEQGSVIRVQMAKLAEWRDEYARKSRHYPDSVRTNSSQSRSEQIKKLRVPVHTVDKETRIVSTVENASKPDDPLTPIGSTLEFLSPSLRETFSEHLKEKP